jgi:tRNA ligase
VLYVPSNPEQSYIPRNNHLTQHRQGIREAISKVPGGPVRTIALYWSLQSLPFATLHRICSDRILHRGENHQTLRPSEAMHEDVIWQFITNTEELGVDEADDIIEMNIQDASVEDAVTRAVDGLLPLLPSLQRPQPTQIAEACDFALGYRTTVRKESDSKGKTPARPRYFGLLAEVDLAALIDRAFLKHRDDPDEAEADSQIAQDFWSRLVAEGRVATRPHVTIIHSKDLPDAQDLWDACDVVSKSDTASTTKGTAQKLIPAPLFEYTFGHLLCDGRVMAIAIDALRLHHAETRADVAKPFLALLDEDFRDRLHITVGTKNKDVAAVEGGQLVKRWRAGEEGIPAIPLFGEGGVGRVKGLS